MADRDKNAELYDDLKKDHSDLMNTVEILLLEIGHQESIIEAKSFRTKEFMDEVNQTWQWRQAIAIE